MFYHPLHPFHPLSAIKWSYYSVLYCDSCDRQLVFDDAYRCEPCKFTICSECADAERARDKAASALKEESISKFTHEGHNPQHTLLFHSKPAAFLCNACQTEKKDWFYHCDHCDDFLIHMSCATLSTAIERPHYHRHPLSLVYSLPEKFYNFKYMCDVCKKRVMQPEWTYHCSNCRYFIHIKCLPNPDQLPSTPRLVEEVTNDSGILHVPMSHAFTDPLKLRFHSANNNNTTIAAAGGGGDDDKQSQEIINHWSHHHPLSLTAADKNNMMPTDGSSSTDNPMITVCHCCVRPLLSSSPYYSCSKQQDGCSFSLHKYCAELPRTFQQHPLHREDHSLQLVINLNTQSTYFTCKACNKRCNAFLYKCETCDFRIDVNCAFLPKIIKHDYFHKRHHLVQHIGPSWISRCTICDLNFNGRVGYKCDDANCNFRLDLHCALKSPRSLPHRYCKGGHEVPLMCPPIDDHPDDFYCDICEEEMHPLIPLYYCGTCKNSFHVRCLSRDYVYENWLEEGTDVSVPDHHHHPLTYVRRKKPPKEVCFGCNGDINGFLFLECRTGNCTYCLCLECLRI
uniref:uncharacterized protein LOC122601727 n=1 Tax=Erigeron canadensis TaxID=72917 RepID=UPI001CB9822B|nr:uncharacterized protein LOC122601727 [Erigeron canadensis]